MLVLEVVGGFVSRSLSLVADANHMLADVAALTLAYAATMLAGRAPTSRHTFGLARAEVLAAFVVALPVGLLLGFLLAEVPLLGSLFRPLVNFLFGVPKSIFLPVFILVFGVSIPQKIAFGVFTAITGDVSVSP